MAIYKDLAEEVVSVAESGALLSEQSPREWSSNFLKNHEPIIVTEFSSARRIATGEVNLRGLAIGVEEYDEDWLGLRERFQVYPNETALGTDFEAYQFAYKELRGRLGDALFPAFPALYEDAVDDVEGDLSCLLEYRLVHGSTEPFYEALLEMYKAGLYPCGWDGRYPDGRFIAFDPLHTPSNSVRLKSSE